MQFVSDTKTCTKCSKLFMEKPFRAHSRMGFVTHTYTSPRNICWDCMGIKCSVCGRGCQVLHEPELYGQKLVCSLCFI